jgi:UDP-GlcNAc:undecaprenyl-phosphate GlcNAc-1-phosphate transferase
MDTAVIWLIGGAVVPSLLIAWTASAVLRQFAPSWGLVDRPGRRKLHAEPVPLGGGLAMWLGVVVPLGLLQLLLWLRARGFVDDTLLPGPLALHWQGLLQQSGRLWFLLSAATVLMLLGLTDDVKGVGWPLRLAMHVIVAALVVWRGWRLALFLDVPWLTAVLSIVWIAGLINSFNMLDNMDGLSAGVAAIASAILAAVMVMSAASESEGPQLFVGGFLLVLLGALLGFLAHNAPPARIYMGDAGSYLIGFCLAAATLTGTFAGGSLPRHAILAPLCALAVPLYDTLSVVLIRVLQGRSPFEADRWHFSHRLVEMGLSPRAAVGTIYLVTTTCGLGALLLYQVNLRGAIVVLMMVGCVLATIAVLEWAGWQRRASTEKQ